MLAQGNNLRLRDQGGSRGRSRTQDQKTRTVSTCWNNPGGISPTVREREKKHVNKFAGLFRDWFGARNLFMCFFRVIPYGGEKHINKIPPKIPGKSREKFVTCFFLYVFFSLPNQDPDSTPTPTSDDFPSDFRQEKWILTKKTWFPLVRERKSWKFSVGAGFFCRNRVLLCMNFHLRPGCRRKFLLRNSGVGGGGQNRILRQGEFLLKHLAKITLPKSVPN